jgi:SAM-dependent methyltransferase
MEASEDTARPKLRGMIYPDEYLVRMFFKSGLHTSAGRVLELGSGSGNNLMHFARFGWESVGLDYDGESLDDCRHNFKACGYKGDFHQHDLNNGLPDLAPSFQALVAASSLYYIRRDSVWRCLQESRPLLAPGAAVYLRMRLPQDHRYGRGVPVERNGWRLSIDYSGEQDLLNVFWEEWELVELLEETLGLEKSRMKILRTYYENYQNDYFVSNSDIIIWGSLP